MRSDIELQALVTEREGMLAANIERQHRGEVLAYPESSFVQLASEIRALNAAELAATTANKDYATALCVWKEWHGTTDHFHRDFAEWCEERLNATKA